ncbi:MAG: DNA-deoxyinosine glycosylase [Blastopirellula sp.]|nr:MAG: DNA-deoxyinosine glycosylase [Blastopirellula sp.]
MSHIHSFPPIAAANAKILILGSIPGKASLLANQYYAYPRNAFWKIIEQLYDINADLSYDQRCTQLKQNQVAVWDVLKSCTRTSSLDSDIVESTIVPNDFTQFLTDHPQIEAIYFNGSKAKQSFNKHVLPNLSEAAANLAMVRLPSTSPAHAAVRFEGKLEAWRVIVG